MLHNCCTCSPIYLLPVPFSPTSEAETELFTKNTGVGNIAVDKRVLQYNVAAGQVILDVDNGASSLRPLRYDPQHQGAN